MSHSRRSLVTFALLATTASAQFYSGYGGGSNPYEGGSGNSGSNGNNDNSDSPNNSNGNNNFDSQSFGPFNISRYSTILAAHAVLATVAFALIFPIGGILIRLASFHGLWYIHALIQIIGYILYITAFGIGIWLVNQAPSQLSLLNNAHPIIGIVLLALLTLQPILGFLHHLAFKRYSRRTFWSYAHIWLGRVVITLGIINGGLGLQLARRMPLAPPSTGAIIGYAVAAGVMWLIYVFAIFVGEGRRGREKAVESDREEELVERKSGERVSRTRRASSARGQKGRTGGRRETGRSGVRGEKARVHYG